MKAFVFDVDTSNVVAEIIGDDEQSIDYKFKELFDDEIHGLIFTAWIGPNDGLITDGDFEVIDVRG